MPSCFICDALLERRGISLWWCVECQAPSAPRAQIEVAFHVIKMTRRYRTQVVDETSLWRREYPKVSEIGIHFEVEEVFGQRGSSFRRMVVHRAPRGFMFAAVASSVMPSLVEPSLYRTTNRRGRIPISGDDRVPKFVRIFVYGHGVRLGSLVAAIL